MIKVLPTIALTFAAISLTACVGSSPSTGEIKTSIKNLGGTCSDVFEISNIEKTNGIKIDDSHYEIAASFDFAVLPQKDIKQILDQYISASENLSKLSDEKSKKLDAIRAKHKSIIDNYVTEREQQERNGGLGDPVKAYDEHGRKLQQFADAQKSEEQIYTESVASSLDAARSTHNSALENLKAALVSKLQSCQTPYTAQKIFAETMGLMINKSDGKFGLYLDSFIINRLSKSMTEGIKKSYSYKMIMIKTDNGWME